MSGFIITSNVASFKLHWRLLYHYCVIIGTLIEGDTMSENCEKENCQDCTHDCSTCGHADGCDHKMPEKLTPNAQSNIKHVVGVVSGKGPFFRS